MTQINLGDNRYDIDMDSDTSIIDALEAEIKFQYRKYNFELRKDSNGVEYPLRISVGRRSLPRGTPVRVFEYSPEYRLISDTQTIRCYSRDTVKSITDLIDKFIQRCKETVELNETVSGVNQEFMDELNRNFPYAKIEYSDSDRWPGQKNHAKIYFDNGHIELYHDRDLTTYITIDKGPRQNTYDVINKLLN